MKTVGTMFLTSALAVMAYIAFDAGVESYNPPVVAVAHVPAEPVASPHGEKMPDFPAMGMLEIKTGGATVILCGVQPLLDGTHLINAYADGPVLIPKGKYVFLVGWPSGVSARGMVTVESGRVVEFTLEEPATEKK